MIFQKKKKKGFFAIISFNLRSPHVSPLIKLKKILFPQIVHLSYCMKSKRHALFCVSCQSCFNCLICSDLLLFIYTFLLGVGGLDTCIDCFLSKMLVTDF